MTFPNTERGRERAREFAAAHLGRADLDDRKRHVVRLLADFELRPLGVRPPKITRLPSFGALLGALLFFLGSPSPSLSREMTLGGVGSAAAALFAAPLLAQTLPDPESHESVGWLLLGGSALLAAVGGLLVFLRREARMQEPRTDTTVSGGPVTIRHEEIYVERHEHDGLRTALEHHKKEIWDVVKGLRSAVSRIETSTAETKVLREANGALLTEVREEVTALGKLVARLSAIVETKLEAKHK